MHYSGMWPKCQGYLFTFLQLWQFSVTLLHSRTSVCSNGKLKELYET